ncbi:MAG: phospholipid carrier-dependent glycosyltransferase [Halobacteriales archaeon]|nr:phospholipid carrier-dependent glycosyltransferase [Halobacteriales archaeon]
MDLRQLPSSSQIAQERVEPGRPNVTFLVGVAAMALFAFGLAAELGLLPHTPTPTRGEVAAAAAPAGLLESFGLAWARIVSAAAFAVSVAATTVATRRLFHSDAVAFLAGALVLLDPGFLAVGRLALPDAIATAGLLSALAFFLSAAPWAHWAGSLALGLAVAADPRSLVWGVPLGLLILLRGHIYAAPRHLGLAGLQALALPALAAGLHMLATDGAIRGVICQPGTSASLGLAESADYGGVIALHNPVTWFGGVCALLFLAANSLSTVARQFRLARLPGRIQMRLAVPLQAMQGRILWVLLLAVLVPFPVALLPVLAMALAAGIGNLAEDAPGFGAAVGLVVLVFAALALVRAWRLVAGTAGPEEIADLLNLVPWTHPVPCP